MKTIFTALVFTFFALNVIAQDFKGSEDHPLITRYTGSIITSYATSNYAEYPIFLDAYVNKTPTKAEGEFTSINYQAPAGRSMLEVHRNYEMALEKKGFKKVYGERNFGTYRYFDYIKVSGMPDEHYKGVAGQFDTGIYTAYQKGENYVAIITGQDYDGVTHTAVDILIAEKMETGMVEVNADVIKDKLNAEGKIAIYGVTFDTGKATIKPASAATIQEIADFLKQNPSVNLYVVGHTDDTGSLSTNMSLSEARANAVKSTLTSKHGISASRLTAQGVGPVSPVSTNMTEAGKAKNRRVELVKRLR